MDLSKFSESRSIAKQVFFRIKYYLLRRLLKRSQTFFMNPADIITRFTLAYDFHERVVYKLLQYIGDNDYNEFMIDIGANIGLTSCQTDGKFKNYYLVEPNPILFNILKANTAIRLSKDSVKAFNIGLSDSKTSSTLMIPKDNWGGAFVLKDNDYDLNTLLSKDGKNDLSDDEYLKQDIQLISSEEFITDVIKDLKSKSLKKGIIKIDVEGFEKKILKSILPILQENSISCFIIFEQWNKDWNPEELNNLTDLNLTYWLLEENDPDIRSFSGLFTILKNLIFGRQITNKLKKISEPPVIGNILVKLDAE